MVFGFLREKIAHTKAEGHVLIVGVGSSLVTKGDLTVVADITRWEIQLRYRGGYPGLLALGAGGCKNCKECTYPDNPCRFPDKMVYLMEWFGLFVTQVCRDCGIPYNHGRGTMTYSACFLLEWVAEKRRNFSDSSVSF